MGVCVSFLIAVDIHPLQLFKDFLVGVCVCVGVYVCVDAFLTYRATQTPLPLSKRLNCVLISCCEFPSRNPTSPLDCRAADRFPPPPPLPPPACTICYISSSLLSLFLRKRGRPRHGDTSAHHKRGRARARHRLGGRTLAGYRRDDAAGVSVFVGNRRTGRWICLFSGFWIVGGLG